MRQIFDQPTQLWIRLGLNEAGPLLSLAAVSLFTWAFVSLASEVFEGETTGLDRTLLLALRNAADLSDPLGPRWFEEVARDFTGLGGNAILTFITVSVIVFLMMNAKRGAAILVAASVGGGTLLSTLLKLGFQRPRPDLVPHGMEVYTASFPSGHAMLSAVTYLTLAALLSRVQARRRERAFLLGLSILLTLLIGASRVYLGVHWPSDVLAGWCIGAAWASLCWFVALQLQRRGQVERPDTSATPPDALTTRQ